MRGHPEVTVIVPVYNGEQYLEQAIESVLSQSYRDYELTLVDDGSTDASLSIAAKYADMDERIVLLSCERNRGVADALNRGLAVAGGRFVALLGQDDIALPDRLEKQVAFMNEHAAVVLLGAQMLSMNANGEIKGEMVFPETDHQIRFGFALQNQMGAPSVMCRSEILRRQNLRFDAAYTGAEDYALWSDLMRFGELRNLPQALVRYRFHGKQLSKTGGDRQRHLADEISARERAKWGVDLSLGAAEREALNQLYILFLKRFRESPLKAEQFMLDVTRAMTERKDDPAWTQVPWLMALRKVQRTGTLQYLARRFKDSTGSMDEAVTQLATSG